MPSTTRSTPPRAKRCERAISARASSRRVPTSPSSHPTTRTCCALLDRGTLFARTEIAAALLGFHAIATLWLSVAPASLERVGAEIASHPEVEFSGAVSGSANLVVSVICRDNPDLYRYLTRSLGSIDAIRESEIVVAVRRLKQAGTIMDGDRLPNPLAE
jgi:DNA-binding Lrp family transcriptional regulator